jgi:hypothetical protein
MYCPSSFLKLIKNFPLTDTNSLKCRAIVVFVGQYTQRQDENIFAGTHWPVCYNKVRVFVKANCFKSSCLSDEAVETFRKELSTKGWRNPDSGGITISKVLEG